MRHLSKNILLLGILLAATAMPGQADNDCIAYGCDTGKGLNTQFGTGRTETYDVAMMLADKAIKGTTIRAFRIPLKQTDNLSGLKVWISKKLTLQTVDGKNVNTPDILSQTAPIAKDTVDVVLDTPYTIDSDTLYVGFSFNVDKVDDNSKRPLTLTTEMHDGGFWIHTSQTYRKWMDYSAKGSTVMQVMLAGLPQAAASATSTERPYSLTNEQTPVTLTLCNHGYTGIQSFDYTYETGTLTGQGHQDLDEPVAAVYNASKEVSLLLPAQAAKGVYPVKITISQINGTDNADPEKDITTEADIYNQLPKHRAVLEEYTGTWCGNCPRGFVGMEVMKRLYPDDFVGISYHNNDPMEIMTASQFPSDTQKGLPDSWLDRTYETDAYYGPDRQGFGIDKTWMSVCNLLAKADIDVKGQLANNNTQVDMEANVTFPLNAHDIHYRVEFVLLADSLHGDTAKWQQTNYFANRYAGGPETFPEPEFAKFYDGDDYVNGLYYNDVAIATTRLEGKDVSLPTTLTADEPFTAKASFNLGLIRNTNGYPLVQDVRQLHAVALLVDENGQVVNAAKAAVAYDPNITSIHTPSTDTRQHRQAEIFDLSGRHITQIQPGVNLVKTAEGKVLKIFKK